MKMRMLIVLLFCLGTLPAAAQSYRATVNEGNELYEQENYDAAKEKYEQAAAAEPDRAESHFNYGNAAYRTDDIKKALEEYENAGTRIRDREELARTLYNAGNVFLKAADEGKDNPVLQQTAGGKGEELRMQGYRQAIEMYKKALKVKPDDQDARYNLTYAKKKLEDLQKQQQNQDKNQDKDQKKDKQKQDKEQDQKNQDKNKDEQQQKKDKQDEQQQKQQNQKDQNQDQKEKAKPDQQQQSKPREQKISKQQAEQILRALERQEKALQKEKRAKVGTRTSVEKDW